jgi:hypothetical protein
LLNISQFQYAFRLFILLSLTYEWQDTRTLLPYNRYNFCQNKIHSMNCPDLM